MSDEELKFINDIIRPWESLNKDLGYAFSINLKISDFTNRASSLAVSIKHIAEFLRKLKPKDLMIESRDYEIISDFADSSKHGALHLPARQCDVTAGSMFERNEDGKVRFLRNVINIHHATYGRVDFMVCTMNSINFLITKLGITTNWPLEIFFNKGLFSDKIAVHASQANQVTWTAMELQFVQLNAEGRYEHVDLNSTIEFTLTAET